MFNIFKKRTVEVNAYTESKMFFDLFQIKRAVEFYPDWWKKLPKPKDPLKDSKTIKTCYGFLELYKKSFILPLWSDFISYQKGDPSFSYDDSANENKRQVEIKRPDTRFSYNFHGEVQYKGMLDENLFDVIKLIGPWKLECKENIDFMITDVFYDKFDDKLDFEVMPGMLNFKYQHSSNFFIKLKKKRYDFKAGMPMLMITPITERPVKFIHHLDRYKFDILDSIEDVSFYNDMFKKMKLDKAMNKSKCPFHFGKEK